MFPHFIKEAFACALALIVVFKTAPVIMNNPVHK